MQLMIDTAADPTDLLRRAANFLITEADARDKDEKTLAPSITPIKPLAFQVDAAPVVDTAAIFGKKSPAGLDGHGENKTAPAAPVSLPLVAPIPPCAPRSHRTSRPRGNPCRQCRACRTCVQYSGAR